jgi:predicted RNA binding protein YcfA (HicA-like mRNA interferase family)
VSYNELIKLIEAHGFRLKSEKGSVRIYTKEGWPNPIRIDYHGSKEIASGTLHWILKAAGIKGGKGDRT